MSSDFKAVFSILKESCSLKNSSRSTRSMSLNRRSCLDQDISTLFTIIDSDQSAFGFTKFGATSVWVICSVDVLGEEEKTSQKISFAWKRCRCVSDSIGIQVNISYVEEMK